MNQSLSGVLGGSPAAVLIRLLVISFVAGMILVAFGFDPESVYADIARMARHLVDFGFDDVKQFGRILLTGAMVVVPIWILLRLLNARR